MIEVLKKHKYFLIMCLLVTFCSGIGQTYLLALFNKDIQSQLGLNSKEISFYYSLATFIASLFLPFVGRFIDKYPFKRVVLSLGLGLSLSLPLLAYVDNAFQLVFVYIFVRLLGQSSLPLSAATTVSRYFGQYRGKVLAVATMGRSFAEGFLPMLVIFTLGAWGFQSTVIFLGAVAFILIIPSTFFLLSGFKEGEPFYPENASVSQVRLENVSFRSVYYDARVYLLSLSNLLLPFILTGVYFHNQYFLAEKSWSLALWGESFIFYAIGMISSNLLGGFLVDRYGAFRVVYLKYLPCFIGLALYLFFNDPIICRLFLLMFGMSVGLSANTKNALLAELFGGRILGTIKSIDATLMVISTSLSPILFAYLIESFGVLSLTRGLMVQTIASLVLLLLVLRSYKNSNRALTG